jgi:hypothetical protein
VLIDEDANEVYVFVSGKTGGGTFCYKSATITTPLSNTQFLPGDCGTKFVDDATYDNLNSPTVSKSNVDITTGIVGLASDDMNGEVYVHNVIGDPPPVVTVRSPDAGDTQVSTAATVQATFSANMNQSTLTNSSFQVVGPGGAVAGVIAYDSASRTATFTPNTLLEANAVYDVTLTTSIQDSSGKALFREENWSFSTDVPTVQFSSPSYSVN